MEFASIITIKVRAETVYEPQKPRDIPGLRKIYIEQKSEKDLVGSTS